jgi:hypothetical protein
MQAECVAETLTRRGHLEDLVVDGRMRRLSSRRRHIPYRADVILRMSRGTMVEDGLHGHSVTEKRKGSVC